MRNTDINIRSALFHIAIIAIYSILTLIVLWPLPLNFGDTIIGWAGDPLLQTWALCWNAHWLRGEAECYFNANICYPEKNTFAFHDPLFAQGLMFFPIMLASNNPILGYNILILLTYVVSAWGTFLCARTLGISPIASFAAGALFAFSPIRLGQLIHLNILSTQWLPFCILTIMLMIRCRKGGWLVTMGFTLFSLLCILSSFYNGLLWGVLVGVICISALIKRQLVRRNAIQLAASFLIVAITISPFVYAIYEVSETYGERRSIGENIKNSAKPQDFFYTHRDSLVYGALMRWLPEGAQKSGERRLFPGLVMILVAGVGANAILRRKLPPTAAESAGKTIDQEDGRSLGDWRVFLFAGLLGLVLCIGPSFVLFWGEREVLLPMPYRLIYEFVPGAQGLRVPARLVVVSVLSGSLLAGLGFDVARQKFRQPRKALVLTVLLMALAFTEGLARLELTRIPTGDQVPAVYGDLAKMPDDTVLLELPTNRYQFDAMYFSTYHFRWLANGRSAYIPPITRKLYLLTNPEWPDAFGPALLDHLLQSGVNTVLVRRDRIEKAVKGRMLKRLNRLHCLVPIKTYTNRDLLFHLNALRGNPSDVRPAVGDYLHKKHPIINLEAEDAYQVYTRRIMRQAVVDGTLCLYERNHIRWLVRIPEGIWLIQMVARNGDHIMAIDSPFSVNINIQIGECAVLERSLTENVVNLSSRPISVEKTAHYAVDCLILHEPPYDGFSLELSNIRLVPLIRQQRK